MRISFLMLLTSIMVMGCGPKPGAEAEGSSTESSAEGGQSGEGFEINWPGGSVKIGEDGGVDVKAPGVDVNTKPGEGVKVKAGDVDVDVDLKQGQDAGGEPEADQSAQVDAADNEQSVASTDGAKTDGDSLIVAYRPNLEVPGFSGQKKTLDRIPPGTRFTDSAPKGWTNLISFVEGELDSGDVSAVSDTVGYYAKLFNLVKLANVVHDDSGKFVLDKVAVGFSMKIDKVNTVVTSDTQKKLGGGLSLIGQGVLDGNIESLDKVEQVARNQTSMLIDAPAIMLKDNEHLEMVVRYFIWVSPGNGQVGTVVWLLDSDPKHGATDIRYAIAEDEVQFLPPNMIEQRSMNVKADRFNVFGIPKKDAFALVRIPQGRGYPYTDELKQVAGLRSYDETSYSALLTAMARTLAAQ